MKIYHYHSDYKYFVCDDDAEQSPLDPPEVFLIPAHATDIEPPEYSEGFVPIFNNDSWEIVEDKRGIYYSTNSPFEQITNENPLELPTENLTKTAPPEVVEGKELVWNEGWVLEDIPPPPVLTPAEKLERAGLTVDELKILLGLT